MPKGESPGTMSSFVAETQVENPGLDFDLEPDLVPLPEAVEGAQLLSVAMGSSLSVLLCLVAAGVCWLGAKSLLHSPKTERLGFALPAKNLPLFVHTLSLFVASFLLFNLFFGGLTAWFVTGQGLDVESYFTQLSALRLARLSHEHFFGYGLSFGVLSLLAFVFVGEKKRVVFPSLLLFTFGGLDIVSWWLTRYVSLGFHTLSYITGGVFAASFVMLYLQICFIHFRILMRFSK